MISNSATSINVYSVLEILVFRIQGLLFGVDGEHVDRLISLEEAEEEGYDLEWFHRKLAFAGEEVAYKQPRVILLAGSNGHLNMVIDQPQDFLKVPIGSIRPLPSVFNTIKDLKPFWGVYPFDNKLVLLVDLFKLDL